MKALMESTYKETGERRLWEKTMAEYTAWAIRADKRGYEVTELPNGGLRFTGPAKEKCDFKVYFE